MSESFNTCHHYVKFDTPQLVDALIDAVKARDLPGMADIDSSLFSFLPGGEKIFGCGIIR